MFYNDKESFEKMFKNQKEEEHKWQLINVASMSHECLNDFLVGIEKDLSEDEVKLMIKGLDKDELEAIDGYDNVDKVLEHTKYSDREKADLVFVFNFIISEEKKHSRWLKALQNGEISSVLKEIKNEH